MTSSTIPASGTKSVVSWESAFWGLVPLALNSMTQPTGDVCGAPAHIDFVLRSSPIICSVDLLFVLVRFVWYIIKEKSLTRAISKLIWFRFRAVDGEESEGSFRNMQKNSAFRWIVFLFAIPQFVKLYAFQGLMWTKLIASMYLGSFLIMELLVMWPYTWVIQPSAANNTEKRVRGFGSTSLPFSSIALAVVFALWFIAAAFQRMFGGMVKFSLLQWIGIVTLFFGAGALLAGFLASATLKRNPHDMAGPFVVLVIVVGLSAAFYFIGSLSGMHQLPLVWSNVISAILTAVWAAGAAKYANIATDTIRKAGQLTQRRVERVLGWYFFGLHLVAAGLYYGFCYDSEGTSRPSWTERLG
ncbi:hypothetical protein MMC28_009145 [Mycoblastus sanguinarius]|nr:hypothetical protein [Mycoblastus sanguinarius]